ncbi:MAG: polyamine ABC transporter ATP-binding protein [Alphaproteobacteria bacterium]|jgi:putrescine transport system ATP-binding protein|nr:polyamine ABC transporter ATP-binding protein [Alphaproteobacteria bacterium]
MRSMNGTGPTIRFDRISKWFGSQVLAVDDVSLDIAANEFFALLGPSGCGKTTLLRILAGFESPSSGSVYLEGRDITAVPPNRRAVNMVFQSYAVFPHMTVGQNVGYGLRVSGLPRREIGRRVEEALALVRLPGYGDRRPEQLSGGQRQRVALARALVKRPRVLLLDEPLSALDRKLREDMQLELVRLRQEIGITFVIVTHDQEEAMSVAGRIAVMESGRLVQIGSPSEIYEHPRSRFVADFIGSVNLLDGRVTGTDGGVTALDSAEAGGPLRARLNGTAAPATGDRAWIGIRPEKLLVDRRQPSREGNALSGEVLEIAYLGERSIIHVRLDSGKVLKASCPNERRFDARGIAAGDRVHVSWSAENGILLTD